jgi:hypothetical protein
MSMSDLNPGGIVCFFLMIWALFDCSAVQTAVGATSIGHYRYDARKLAKLRDGNVKTSELSINKRVLSACGTISFAVYNSALNTSTFLQADPYFFTYPKGRILLDKYPNGTINIITNVYTGSCSPKPTIGCVNTVFGNFRQSFERVAPFTLYGDDPATGQIFTAKPNASGFQLLIAKAYTKSDCTGIPIAETIADIQLVPKTVATIRSKRFIAMYNGTAAPIIGVPWKDTAAVFKVTCEYIRESLSYGFVYKGSLSFDSIPFKCLRFKTETTGNATTSAANPAIGITYQIVATFSIGGSISPYLNQDMPTSATLSNFITLLFLDQATRGPGDSLYLSDDVRAQIAPPNVYSNFTNIALA